MMVHSFAFYFARYEPSLGPFVSYRTYSLVELHTHTLPYRQEFYSCIVED